uniref:DUF3500 domain-containing protein n=1 Tax=Streptomyces flaveolus TaxID=67297 RepID=D3UA05_9ACTN|nr:hypothetical protein [Streptomyces flaveolus]
MLVAGLGVRQDPTAPRRGRSPSPARRWRRVRARQLLRRLPQHTRRHRDLGAAVRRPSPRGRPHLRRRTPDRCHTRVPRHRAVPVLHPARHPDQPERAEQQALSALLQSLDASQAAAGLRERHDDLLLGPHRDWKFPRKSEGIAAHDLTAAQRDLLVAAIARYVGDLPEADARRFLDRYRAELPDTHVGFTGSTLLTDPGDYVRIDGPSVWIEFSMHDGIVLADPHPHAVWRDKHTDYGGLKP